MSGVDHLADLARVLRDQGDALTVTCERWGRCLADALEAGGRLLIAGNGGSAAQAAHLGAELVGRYQDERQPYSAIVLSAEASTVTAIANDYGVEEVFARQVRAHGRPGDVLVLMTTSGRSRNLVSAALAGTEKGLQVWAMTGRAPSPVASVSYEVLAVDADRTCTVQEVHLVALHLLCESFDRTVERRLVAAGMR